jgi:uncharacterized NAD-dependent epimerase/dehydratase family protein
VALTVKTYTMKEADAREFAAKATKELGIPAILPLEDGVEALVPIFKQMIDESIAQV